MKHRAEPRPLLHRVLPVRRWLPQRGAVCAVKATTLIAILAAGFAVSLTGSAATSAGTVGSRAAVAGTSASTLMQASALPRGGTGSARGPSLSSVAAARLAAGRRAQALTPAAHQGDVRRAIRAQAAGLRRAQAVGVRRAKAVRVSRARERARLMADPQEGARLLAAQRGWGARQFACLDSLWAKESRWQHTADNPTSSAFGIPQALPGSKMASAGGDWRTNPMTQVRWGLGYIAARYDTPCRAWRHSQSNNWY